MANHDPKHLYIPDPQVHKGVPINHLYWLAYFAMDKGVDVVIHAGDHYDMPSLSMYDARGSKSAEGRRVQSDMDAGDRGLEVIAEIWAKRGFKPKKHVTLGNHENRRQRAIERDPHLLEDVLRDFKFKDFGWEVHPFLEPVTINGVRYSHFFPHNNKGQIVQTKRGAPSAHAQVQRLLCSATAGHKQGLDVSIFTAAGGLRRGLIAGSFYLHDESYMPENNYWRGVILKHTVRDGNYALCEVPIAFLESKYRRFVRGTREA